VALLRKFPNTGVPHFSHLWREVGILNSGDDVSPGLKDNSVHRFIGYERLSMRHRQLNHLGSFFKLQPRIARVELAGVAVSQVADKVRLPLAVGKELGI
jgi:hypothetical protein